MGVCILQRITVEKMKILPNDMLDLFYPIGKTYITEINSISPSDLFGGDWEQIVGCYLKTTTGTDGGTKDGSMMLDPAVGNTSSVTCLPYHQHTCWREKKVSTSKATGNVITTVTANSTNHVTYAGGDGTHSHTLNNHVHNIKLKTSSFCIWRRIG